MYKQPCNDFFADIEDGVITAEGEIINEKIEGKDGSDAPSRVLIGPNMDGKAFELKDKIQEYREYLVSLVDEDDLAVIHSLEINLETNDPPPSKESRKNHL